MEELMLLLALWLVVGFVSVFLFFATEYGKGKFSWRYLWIDVILFILGTVVGFFMLLLLIGQQRREL